MKKIYLFAAMAAMLASCSSDDLSVGKQTAPQQTANVPVAFDSYVNRATTRAGYAGDVTTAGLQTGATLKDAGFGVFAYYTDGVPYSETSIPDFMYNQQVKWNGTDAFTYSPVKFWPNEHGAI